MQHYNKVEQTITMMLDHGYKYIIGSLLTGALKSPWIIFYFLACRETAFIYAMMAASVLHAVTRGCTEGSIQSCSCNYKAKQNKGALT